MTLASLRFYDVVVSLHVMAVVIAFGINFAYPIIVPWIRRQHPTAMPAIHDAQDRLGKMLQTPGMVVVLVAGVYLASDADVWSQVWVSVPLVILVVLFGLGGAYFAPQSRKLGELARRDLSTSGELGAEYDALLTRVLQIGVTTAMLVLVAIFFMVAKPG